MERGEKKIYTSRMELNMKELEEIIRRASISEKDREKLRMLLETHTWLQSEISRKDVSLARLRKMIFGTSKTEKIQK